MIDILLLCLFVSIVLVGASVFLGKEELRAQRGRAEAIYAQAQLVGALNYRLDEWGNRSALEMINMKFCEKDIRTVGPTNCSLNDPFYIKMQTMLNRTGRPMYNYIFYASATYLDNSTLDFTVCNLQPTVCGKHIPAIARTEMQVACPDGERIAVVYLHGIWPSWMKLPLECEQT